MDTSPFPAKNPLYITLTKVQGRVQKLRRLSPRRPAPPLALSHSCSGSKPRRGITLIELSGSTAPLTEMRKSRGDRGRRESIRVRTKDARKSPRVQKLFQGTRIYDAGNSFLTDASSPRFARLAERFFALRYIKHRKMFAGSLANPAAGILENSATVLCLFRRDSARSGMGTVT